MKLSFTKMQGCANDYIYLDCRESGVPENIAAFSEKLSRRHFSIGADGIICICAAQSAGADGMMRIFNADGSEGRMCGNGIRCVGKFLIDHGYVRAPEFRIETGAGLRLVRPLMEGGVCIGATVEMGRAEFPVCAIPGQLKSGSENAGAAKIPFWCAGTR